MFNKINIRAVLLTGMLAASVASATFGQANPGDEQAAQSLPAAPSPASASLSKSISPLIASQRSKHAETLYRSVWGVDKLEVRETASGNLLRFSYRVSDENKAVELNDKKATPYLIDEKTGAVLQVPTMPKVGMLRQTGNPVKGMEYWMVFSNKRNYVKPGSRVDIVIGMFRANGLIVQ